MSLPLAKSMGTVVNVVAIARPATVLAQKWSGTDTPRACREQQRGRGRNGYVYTG